jgi:apolipoprotein N-acyltransferase
MGITIILVYATWGIAPLLAYQALMAGLKGEGRNFAILFAVYAGAVGVTWASLSADVARAGFGPVSPVAVIAPAVATAVLSAALYLLGRKARGGGK